MFFDGRIVVRLWVSLEIRRFTCRRPILNLLKTCATALFSTSSLGSDAVGAICGPPIKVSLTNSVGRGVFATRSIGSGELIHTANPIVSHPSLSLSDRVCYQCLRKLNKDASGCTPLARESVSYGFCSKECRSVSKGCYEVESKADWSLYHDHCRAYGLKYPLMVKRFACMVISGAASADSLDILQPARLPPEAVLQIEEQFELLKSALLKVEIDENLIRFLTKHWFMGVLARVHINAFRIELVTDSYEDLLVSAIASVATQASVGNAVYMLPSFYNHNCDPNTHIVWIDSAAAKLKALRDIEEGEELRICYIDASMDHNARQKLLSQEGSAKTFSQGKLFCLILPRVLGYSERRIELCKWLSCVPM